MNNQLLCAPHAVAAFAKYKAARQQPSSRTA
jgi:hypothetical protein